MAASFLVEHVHSKGVMYILHSDVHCIKCTSHNSVSLILA